MNENYTKKYDDLLKKMDHYSRFPEMLPWVGTDYDNINGLQLLIIEESHYLPENSEIHNDESWYKYNNSMLNEDEKEYINTRKIISNGNFSYNLSRRLADLSF